MELKTIRKEIFLLRKQLTLIVDQIKEIKHKFSILEEKYERINNILDTTSKRIFRDHYSLKDFFEKETHELSPVLYNAIEYYETHDGCPFYYQCGQRKFQECDGIWVKMGSPCSHFIKKIKSVKKERI
ncbi:MAG: hypothetical protein ACTSVY_13530 [Candidatus Helarchaeota archaeon]